MIGNRQRIHLLLQRLQLQQHKLYQVAVSVEIHHGLRVKMSQDNVSAGLMHLGILRIMTIDTLDLDAGLVKRIQK